jgi:flavin reductase (DIM6/NTAB) family NADH-FMN oxidoreductase RutF
MNQAGIAAVLGKLDSEVFVLTAADGDRRNGQIVGYLECEVRSGLDGGTHLFYLADVLEGRLVVDREPLRLSQLPALLPPEDLSTMIRLLEQDILRDLALLR